MQAESSFQIGSVRAGSILRSLIVVVMVVSLCFSSVGLGQQEGVPAYTEVVARDVNAPAPSPFPFIAEITGNDVYLRSGGGTNYYQCGKLYKGDRVQVVKTELGWSCIVPPADCFSWVSMQCIGINLDDPTMGIVTSDGVWVYAGSDYVEPMHSTSKQVMLKRGDKVKLLGEEKDDYYKITSPPGAFLWVSSQFTETVGPVKGQPQPEVTLTTTPGETPPAKGPIEQEQLKLFYELQAKLKAEQDKPLAERTYAEIGKALTEITETEGGGRAARYAQFVLKQIERFELAQKVAKELQQQNQQLDTTTKRIDKALAARLANVQDLGRFIVIGKLRTSSIYGAGTTGGRRYRVVNSAGRTIAYVVPTGSALRMNLTEFVGKKVGLVGVIKPHQPTAGAIVEFTNIAAVD